MNKQKGFSQIAVMIVMLVLAVALPITTNLVKKSQESRSQATNTAVDDRICTSMGGTCGFYGDNPGATCIISPNDVHGIVTSVKQNTDGAWPCIGGVNRVCCIPNKDTECKKMGGTCGNYGGDGATCQANGVSGTVHKNKVANSDTNFLDKQDVWPCSGGNDNVCCVPNKEYIPECTESNWTSTLSPTTCPSNGKQTKTWTKSGNCSGGISHPDSEVINCTYEAPACVDSNWTSSISPTTCPSNGKQTKTWTKSGNCSGGISHPGSEVINCCTTDKNFCDGDVVKYCTGGQNSTVVDCTSSSQKCSIINGIGQCTTKVSSSKVSFKVSFSGLMPGALCESTYMKNITVTLNSSVIKTGVTATKVNETNVNGEQVYLVSDLTFGGIYGSTNNLRVKGYDHSQMKYCTNSQTGKAGDICSLKLDGSTYNFSNYPILAGDMVDRSTGVADGRITSMDFGIIKNNLNPDAAPACGREGDLNGDGVVNNIDMQLIKDALSKQEDQ